MFAPRHHAAMKHVIPVRRELAVRTIFNFLGPLTNPAGATRQLMGVSDRRYQETVAEALAALGCERGLVVSAEDGTDEIALASPTRVIELRDGKTSEWFTSAEELGFEPARVEDGRRRRARRERGRRRGGLRRRAGAGPRHHPRQRRRGDPGRRRRPMICAAAVARAAEAVDSRRSARGPAIARRSDGAS